MYDLLKLPFFRTSSSTAMPWSGWKRNSSLLSLNRMQECLFLVT